LTGNPQGVWLHEQWAAHGDALLARHGIKPALLAYLAEICRCADAVIRRGK
jgi:hypothetical protein